MQHGKKSSGFCGSKNKPANDTDAHDHGSGDEDADDGDDDNDDDDGDDDDGGDDGDDDGGDGDDDVNIMHHLGQRCMLAIVSALQIQTSVSSA